MSDIPDLWVHFALYDITNGYCQTHHVGEGNSPHILMSSLTGQGQSLENISQKNEHEEAKYNAFFDNVCKC